MIDFIKSYFTIYNFLRNTTVKVAMGFFQELKQNGILKNSPLCESRSESNIIMFKTISNVTN